MFKNLHCSISLISEISLISDNLLFFYISELQVLFKRQFRQ